MVDLNTNKQAAGWKVLRALSVRVLRLQRQDPRTQPRIVAVLFRIATETVGDKRSVTLLLSGVRFDANPNYWN